MGNPDSQACDLLYHSSPDRNIILTENRRFDFIVWTFSISQIYKEMGDMTQGIPGHEMRADATFPPGYEAGIEEMTRDW